MYINTPKLKFLLVLKEKELRKKNELKHKEAQIQKYKAMVHDKVLIIKLLYFEVGINAFTKCKQLK